MFKSGVRILGRIAFAVGGVSPVAAQDGVRALSAIAFSSLEADSRSTFSSSGGKLVIPLDAGDLSAFVQVSSGSSLSDALRARRGKMLASETAVQARLTAGAEGALGAWFLSGGLGPSMARLARKGGGGVIRLGAIIHGDIWFRPAQEQVVTLGVAADSAERSLWARLRYGYRFTALPFAVGPELAASISPTGRKLKAGLHLGALRWWRFNADLSGGMMWDRRGAGQYLTASVWMTY